MVSFQSEQTGSDGCTVGTWIAKRVRNKGTYIQPRIARLARVATDNRIFPRMLKHALLQVFRQVLLHYDLALDDTLGASMGAGVAVSVGVVLGFLHRIDHVCHRLNIFGLVGRDLLHALALPGQVFAIGHGGLVFCFVGDVHDRDQGGLNLYLFRLGTTRCDDGRVGREETSDMKLEKIMMYDPPNCGEASTASSKEQPFQAGTCSRPCPTRMDRSP